MSGRSIVAVYDVVDDDHFETSRHRGSFVMFGKIELPAVPASSQSNGATSGNGSTGPNGVAPAVGESSASNAAGPGSTSVQLQAQLISSLPSPPPTQQSASKPTYFAYLKWGQFEATYLCNHLPSTNTFGDFRILTTNKELWDVADKDCMTFEFFPDKPERIDDNGNPFLGLWLGYGGFGDPCPVGWAKKRVDDDIEKFDENQQLPVWNYGDSEEEEEEEEEEDEEDDDDESYFELSVAEKERLEIVEGHGHKNWDVHQW